MTAPERTLDGKVAVVTGASRGIGRATAIALARAGTDVVCVARSTDDARSKLPGTIDDTARAVKAAGRRALAAACDLRSDADVAALGRRALEAFGRVDVLVNNAAVNYRAPFLETPAERWDLIMNVNLRGTVLCTQAFLPGMLDRGTGSIINVSSGAVDNAKISADLGLSAYAASKAAVEELTAILGAEVAPKGVGVNCLRIESAVVTEGARLVDPSGDYTGWETPEACADAIGWLARKVPPYTGRVVTIADVRDAMVNA
jgi:NAD(P)-dependent dehydrogenase (short-subunit alcohol dehydrogenase family)